MPEQEDNKPTPGDNEEDNLDTGSELEDEDGNEGDGEDEGSGKDEDLDTVPRSELKKAIASRQILKRRLRDTEKKMADLEKANETEAQAARREEREKALQEQAKKYKPLIVRKEAEAQLLAANVKGGKKGIPRLVRLMDLTEIEVNEDGDVDGVDEEVARLIEDYPELFGKEEAAGDEENEEEEKPKRRRRPSSRAADGAGKKAPPKKETTSELLFRGLTGRSASK